MHLSDILIDISEAAANISFIQFPRATTEAFLVGTLRIGLNSLKIPYIIVKSFTSASFLVSFFFPVESPYINNPLECPLYFFKNSIQTPLVLLFGCFVAISSMQVAIFPSSCQIVAEQ